jgi:hypothetical protein
MSASVRGGYDAVMEPRTPPPSTRTTHRIRCAGQAPPDAGPLAERWLEELAFELQIDLAALPELAPIQVHVGPRPSGTVGSQVWIEARTSGPLGPDGWFELLLRHELVHLLIESAWGRGPALLWEGLPIALADARVRARYGISYRDHCRAVAAAGRLVPLGELVLASSFYARRTDPRVDLQAGAFCGWLLQQGALPALAELLRSWHPPTPDRPVVDLTALPDLLGEDLLGLERRWRASLAGPVPPPDLVARWLADPPSPRRPHCDFCFGPRAADPCDRCGAPAVPVSVRLRGEGVPGRCAGLPSADGPADRATNPRSQRPADGPLPGVPPDE